MQLPEVVRTLEQAGTAQTRKTYARHGIGPNMYGVSYANLNALAKKIKRDQPLAERVVEDRQPRLPRAGAEDRRSGDDQEVDARTPGAKTGEPLHCGELAKVVVETPYAVELEREVVRGRRIRDATASRLERHRVPGRWTTKTRTRRTLRHLR